MSRKVLTAIATTMSSVCVAAAAPPTSRPAPAASPAAKPLAALLPPTREESQKSYDDGQYGRAIAQIQQALNPKVQSTDAARFELLMLKGETLLRMSRYAAAREAFGDAAEIATASNSETRAATARATQRLVIEVKGPASEQRLANKEGKARDVGLLDLEKREQALESLRDESRAVATRRTAAAHVATTLPTVLDALQLLAISYDLEMATGRTADARGDRATFEGLAGRARRMIREALTSMNANTSMISDSASTSVVTPDSLRIGYRGLSKADRQDLEATIETCTRILSVVKLLNRSAGADAQTDKRLFDDTRELMRVTGNVLNQPYR
jgi:tetratricopeptide (TPR) repeat protein